VTASSTTSAPRLRVAFLGTPEFSVPALEALLVAGYDIVAVYCQPPRPAGRGQKPRPSPVQSYAESQGLTVRTPKSLKSPEEQKNFTDLASDVAIVVAYGLILPAAILAAPKHGCVNIHASLLPRWRGAAPIQRAILAGDRETGVAIMQMDEGLDTGAVLAQEAVPIGDDTTAEDLHDTLAALGARMVVEVLPKLAAGTITARPQPEQGVTYAEKLRKEEAHLDWSRSAEELHRMIRAFTPWPGAWTHLEGTRVKVLEAEVVEGAGAPGEVLDSEATVACGKDALRLRVLQRAGKAPMDVEFFLRGTAMPPGTRLT